MRPATVAAIEARQSRGNARTLVKLARALDARQSDLLETATPLDSLTRSICVFVSGPLGHDESRWDDRLRTALTVAGAIEAMDPWVWADVPHLDIAWHRMAPAPYEHWFARCLARLSRADFLYRIPGKSPGADREWAFAVERGIPAYEDLLSLDEAIDALKLERCHVGPYPCFRLPSAEVTA